MLAKVSASRSAYDTQGVEVQEYVASQGISVAIPLRTSDGAISLASDSGEITDQEWVESVPFAPSEDDFLHLGIMTAEVHRLKVPEHLSSTVARFDPTQTLKRTVEELRRLSEAMDRHQGARLSEISVECESLRLDRLPLSLIHTDITWPNVVKRESGELVLIDFDRSGCRTHADGPPGDHDNPLRSAQRVRQTQREVCKVVLRRIRIETEDCI